MKGTCILYGDNLRSRSMRAVRVAILGLWIASLSSAVHAQNTLAGKPLSVEVSGGTHGAAEKLAEQPKFNLALERAVHLDLARQPCLLVSPIAQPQLVNSKIYDHILLLDNHCATEIKIRACYYGSSNCKEMSVGGYRREQKMLGVDPSTDFRFSYREYLD